MNHDTQTLQGICQSTQMGQNSIRAAIKKVRSPALQQALSSQLWEYHTIHRQAQKLLQDRGQRAISIPRFLLTLSRLETGRKIPEKDCAIAKWMIEDHSRMLLQNRSKSPLDPKVSTLSNRLLQTAQENIAQMTPFLLEPNPAGKPQILPACRRFDKS